TAVEPFYTTLDNLQTLQVTDKGLHVKYLENTPEGRSMHGKSHWIPFRSDDEARTALTTLQRRIRSAAP
ncbi:MAG TPA: hypothetical protein VIF12_03995, partial [Micavibrio sp.]